MFACEQVVGVLGNHVELVAPTSSLPANVATLDGDTIKIHGLKVEAVSGVISGPKRHLRRTEDDFLTCLELATAEAPDLFLLHQGPDDPDSC